MFEGLESSEKRRPGDPVGHLVPEMFVQSTGDLALGLHGQAPQGHDLLRESGLDPATVRRHYLQQLAEGGIELVN